MERFPSVVADIANELITICGEASIKEAAEVMLEHHIGSIIVVENGKPIGIVTKSDLLSRVLVERPELSIWSLLFVALGEGLAIYGLIVAILLSG